MTMKDYELVQTMDAQIWAKEFMHTFGADRRNEIDEGLMIGWFANAIMTGYDHAHWEQSRRKGSFKRFIEWFHRRSSESSIQ